MDQYTCLAGTQANRCFRSGGSSATRVLSSHTLTTEAKCQMSMAELWQMAGHVVRTLAYGLMEWLPECLVWT